MIKKTLLTTLLILGCLLGAGELMGQSIVTIGTSTNANTYIPTQTTQTYSFSQQIYKATEISGTGTIKSIAFYATANGCTRSLDIYLINTTKETFSSTSDWINVSDSDKVFSGSVTFSNNSWTTVTVSDFTYTGNNLALVVHDKTNNTESSATSFRYNSISSSVLYKLGDDASSPITAPTTGTRVASRNNIQLSIAYDYPEPTELTVSDITNESASIAWTDCTATTGNTFSRYEYQLKTTGVYGSLTTTSNPCELSGLEAGTMYTIRVRAVYTDSASNEHTSKWVETSFTTECNPIYNLDEAVWDFEITSDLPDCWKKKASYTSSNYTYPCIRTSDGHNNAKCIWFYSIYDEILLMPAIEGGLNGNTLKFFAKAGANSGTFTITIGYYNSQNVFTAIENVFDITDEYNTEAFEVDFSGLPSDVDQVAIKGYARSGYNLYLDDVSIVATDACTPVSSPTVGTVTYNSAQLSWTAGGSETNWKLQYRASGAGSWTTVNVSSANLVAGIYTLAGLSENTTYEWQVAAWCDTSDNDNISTYVAGEGFSTPVQFPMPTSLAANNISTNSADITWTAGSTETAWQLYYTPYDYATPGSASPGDYINISTTHAYTMTGLTGNTTYYVYVRADYGEDHYSSWTDAMSFRTTVLLPYSYDFTDASELNSWTLYNCHPSTGITVSGSNYYFHFNQHSSYNPQYLITPLFENNSNALLVSFDYRLSSGILSNILNVGYSTTDKEIGSFTWPSSATVEVNSTSYHKFEYIFQVEGIKYIAVKYDRNGIYLNTDIDNISFTPIDKVYTGGSEEWNYLADWAPAGLPESTDDVYINNTITIPNTCTAEANNIILGPSGSITIADGGQLICNNDVQATLQKNIEKWDVTQTQGGNYTDGWYFIASPVDGYSTENMIITDYTDTDLYSFDNSGYWYNAQGSDHSFSTLTRGQGYLYANSSGTDIAFTGEVPATNSKITMNLSNGGSGNTQGYNLMGNPFTCNLTNTMVKIKNSDNSHINITSYYTVEDGTELYLVNDFSKNPIKPGRGFLIQSNGEGQKLVFNPVAKSEEAAAKPSFITIEAGNDQFIDRACIQFGNGNTLRKMSINDHVSHVYVVYDGKDYAAATITEMQGEIPVYFVAAKNGQYTIKVKTDNLETSYLHLIDNLTGANIDLLQTPSYTFQGNTTDISARFRLLFTTTGVDENPDEGQTDFAFISDGQLIVNGTGTLYVYDALGRQISAKQVTPLTSNLLPLTSGVYVLQLVEGNSVRTQKIIVR